MFLCTIMNILKNKSINLLALVAIIASLLGACHSDKKEKDEQKQEQQDETALEDPTIETVAVKKGELSSNIAVPGELMPYSQVELYAKINSYVKKLYIDIGSVVHQGQLLATLEAPEINSQLLGAQSKVKQQQAMLYASKANYDRLFSTSKTPGTVSQNDIDQAEARKNSDQANVEAAQSAYKEIAANLAYLEIRAPFDGVITVRNITLGAYVGPGRTVEPLLVLEDQTKLRLVVSVPEVYTRGLSLKNTVSFSVRSLPGKVFQAKIKRLAGALDIKLRAERVEMDVFNKDKQLLPHMYADVNVPLPSNDSTFILPKTAVVTSTEKVFVIRVNNHHAEWVNVQKGIQSGDYIEVFGKLNNGDQVIKIATDEIRDGSDVKDKAAGTGKNEAKKDSTNTKKS
ncbi:MAG: mdtE 1 [Mucilaginibacter sp.]|nr:mdtE 1 [Mucilaginibacter sp.]